MFPFNSVNQSPAPVHRCGFGYVKWKVIKDKGILDIKCCKLTDFGVLVSIGSTSIGNVLLFWFFFQKYRVLLRRTCYQGACKSSTVKAPKRQMTKMGRSVVWRRQWLKVGRQHEKKMQKQPMVHCCDSFISKGSPERLKGFLAPMHLFWILCLHNLALPSALPFPWPQPYRSVCSATCSSLAKLLFPIS